MAPEQKLRRLPATHRRSKRPLTRPPIASPYTNASQPKVVYISASTPFISAVKRVRKLLSQIDKRAVGKASLLDQTQARSEKQTLQAIASQPANPEAVYLRATGRAIQKALNLALYFQNQQDCQIQLKTGTVGTVDDIVETDHPNTLAEPLNNNGGDAREIQDNSGNSLRDGPEDIVPEDDDEIPETQIRKASFLEVAVRLAHG